MSTSTTEEYKFDIYLIRSKFELFKVYLIIVQLGLRQGRLRAAGPGCFLLRNYRGRHRPRVHRRPFRSHSGPDLVQFDRRLGRRRHELLYNFRPVRLFALPHGHGFRQLLHAYVHSRYNNRRIIELLGVTKNIKSIGVCRTDRRIDRYILFDWARFRMKR